jgi:hypothetical protein
LTGKQFSPSSQRLAAAAGQGFFASSGLLVFGVSGLALSGLIRFGAPVIIDTLLAMVQTNLAGPQNLQGALISFKSAGLTIIAAISVTTLGFAAAASLLQIAKVKKKGSTAIPLPQKIPYKRDMFTIGAVSISVFTMVVLAVFFRWGFTFNQFIHEPKEALLTILTLLSAIIFTASLIAIAGGIMQLSMYRIRLYKELSLSRNESARESFFHGAKRQKR